MFEWFSRVKAAGGHEEPGFPSVLSCMGHSTLSDRGQGTAAHQHG